MKIVDLRPGPVRVWQSRTYDAAGGPGTLPGRLWTRAVDRYLARRAARRTPPPAGLRVVSVGNLALGGTGKTPVAIALGRDLAARGVRGAVLTRGYGSRLKGPFVVDATRWDAGDEARLMARELAETGWLVVQARERAVGLAWLARHEPACDTVILEDGHQNAVGRHLDVLILDRWSVAACEPAAQLVPAAGPVVPWGPWRESVRGVDRADVLLVEAEHPPEQAVGGHPVAAFRRRLRLAGDPCPGEPWIAVSGIARPEIFEAGVTEALGCAPEVAIRCVDHAAYGSRLRERILAEVRRAGGPRTVTTAKDWVKLAGVWPADLPVVVARQELQWTGNKALPDLVGERLDACLR